MAYGWCTSVGELCPKDAFGAPGDTHRPCKGARPMGKQPAPRVLQPTWERQATQCTWQAAWETTRLAPTVPPGSQETSPHPLTLGDGGRW